MNCLINDVYFQNIFNQEVDITTLFLKKKHVEGSQQSDSVNTSGIFTYEEQKDQSTHCITNE